MGTLAFCLSVLVFSAIYLVATRIIRKPLSSAKTPLMVWILDFLIWPIGIIALFMAVDEFFGMSTMPELHLETGVLKSFSLHIAIFWLIARGVDLLFLRWFVFHRTGFTTPALLRGLSYVFFIVAGLSLFLLRTGYPITGFLVSTGLAAGILGLALQSTLNDLFSGIALSLEKPFHIGEWIELEDKTVGQVIDLTWRATHLKTFENTLLTIPNSTMARQPINNLDNPEALYAVWNIIQVSPDADPELVITILSTALGQCRHVLRKPVPTVRLSDASSSPYKYMVWVHYRSYLAHFRGQEQLYLEIHRALKNAGITPMGEVQEVRYARAKAVNPVRPSVTGTLRSMEIFSELDVNEIEEIESHSEFILVADDTVVVNENSCNGKVHVVVNGSLEASIAVADGHYAQADLYSAGDSFGWAAIVTDEKSIMTVRATSDSMLLVIDGDCLQPILQRHEELRHKFTELVSQRIQRFTHIRSKNTEARKSMSPIDIRHRIERFISHGSNRN